MRDVGFKLNNLVLVISSCSTSIEFNFHTSVNLTHRHITSEFWTTVTSAWLANSLGSAVTRFPDMHCSFVSKILCKLTTVQLGSGFSNLRSGFEPRFTGLNYRCYLVPSCSLFVLTCTHYQINIVKGNQSWDGEYFPCEKCYDSSDEK